MRSRTRAACRKSAPTRSTPTACNSSATGSAQFKAAPKLKPKALTACDVTGDRQETARASVQRAGHHAPGQAADRDLLFDLAARDIDNRQVVGGAVRGEQAFAVAVDRNAP